MPAPGKVGFVDIDRGYGRAMKRIKEMDGLEITVGYHAGKKRKGGTPMALIAAVHEFGTRDGKVPPRPTLGPTADRKGKAWRAHLRRRLSRGLTGFVPASLLAQIVARAMAEDVKVSITRRVRPRLADATIRRKGSSKPLIDTGAMRQSVEGRAKGSLTKGAMRAIRLR